MVIKVYGLCNEHSKKINVKVNVQIQNILVCFE